MQNENFDYGELIISLIDHMIDNGLSVENIPTIEIVDDDVENATNVFGKTGYYDPNSKILTVYTYNRHPKDVLRTIAHEMIHVEQDKKGLLDKIDSQRITDSEYLTKIEASAYELGNLLFRAWTEEMTSSVNEEDRQGKKAYAHELSLLREKYVG